MTPQDKAEALRARKKEGPPIAALTAWDYPTGRLMDEAGADLILVGDSMGMVVLGFSDTTHVTLEHIAHHTAAVARGCKRALLVGDFPYRTYETVDQAVETAHVLVKVGAEAVKLEGGVNQADKVRAIVAEGIPVMGHIGMLPQRILEEKVYRKKGKSEAQIAHLHEGGQALQEAGCFSIVLESVVPEVAAELTTTLAVPTVGVGSGVGTCDGEIAVSSDVIGSYPWFVPPFAKPRGDVAGEISRAVASYVEHCRQNAPARP